MGRLDKSAGGNFIPTVFRNFGNIINASGAKGGDIISVIKIAFFNPGKFGACPNRKIRVFSDVIKGCGAFIFRVFSAVGKVIGNFSDFRYFVFGKIPGKDVGG